MHPLLQMAGQFGRQGVQRVQLLAQQVDLHFVEHPVFVAVQMVDAGQRLPDLGERLQLSRRVANSGSAASACSNCTSYRRIASLTASRLTRNSSRTTEVGSHPESREKQDAGRSWLKVNASLLTDRVQSAANGSSAARQLMLRASSGRSRPRGNR